MTLVKALASTTTSSLAIESTPPQGALASAGAGITGGECKYLRYHTVLKYSRRIHWRFAQLEDHHRTPSWSITV